MNVAITVNGQVQNVEVAANTLLVTVLREQLGLTGTHVGCDTSQCGACTVHLDGRAVKSCSVLAVQAQGAEVVTIEGIGSTDDLHPMQAAFQDCHGLQCGFCTPGMIMQAIDLVTDAQSQSKPLDSDAIRHGLEGNICRCTGYQNIVAAVAKGAAELSSKAKGA
jgi:carbon-monoxide dehydrogenase small subunit